MADEPEAGPPDEATTARGQRVVKVTRPRGRPRTRPVHVPLRDIPPPPVTALDDIPPDESDPLRREEASIGRIELTEEGAEHLEPAPPAPAVEEPPAAPPEVPDFTDATADPRTFDDLMGMFPVGDQSGLYYIHVERKSPRGYAGYATSGVLRKIRRRMTIEEFKEEYGGGDYLFIVYGPPRRGRGILDPRTMMPAPKALTKPVRVTIPFAGAGGIPPNPDSAYEDEEQAMENSHGFPNLPHLMTRGTPAGAKMYETHVAAEERRAEREREERRERRNRHETQTSSAIDIVTKQAERREQQLVDMVNELRAELKAAQDPKNRSSDVGEIVRAVSTLNPQASKSEINALTEGHRREVETLERRHRDEIDSLTRRHTDEVTRLRSESRADVERVEARVAGIESRADQRVKDVEQKIEDRDRRSREEREQALSALKADHGRELEMVRGEHQRNTEALRLAHTTQLETERGSYERELRTRSEIAESRFQTEKSRLEAEVKRLETDARKTARDVEEMKRLVEHNKDLGKLMAEAEKHARLLGYTRREDEEGAAAEPMDWKQMIMTAVVEGVKQMPQIIQKAGESLSAVRRATPDGQVQGLTMPQAAPVQMLPSYQPGFAPPQRVFATEGAEPSGPPAFFENPAMGGMRPPSLMQEPTMRVQQQPMPVSQMVVEQAGMQMPQAAAQQQVAEVAPAPRLQAAAAAPVPAPSAPAAPQAAPPAQPEPRRADHELGSPDMDAAALQGKDELEKHFRARTPAQHIVAGLIAQHGIQMVRAFQPMASADVVVGALTRAGHGDSRLLSYKGRRYLREIEAAVAAALAAN